MKSDLMLGHRVGHTADLLVKAGLHGARERRIFPRQETLNIIWFNTRRKKKRRRRKQ